MPRPGRMTTERAKDFKGSLLQLLRTMGKHKLSSSWSLFLPFCLPYLI